MITRDNLAPRSGAANAVLEAVADAMSRADVVVLRPGDRLVFAFPDRLDMATHERLRNRIRRDLPGLDFTIIDGGPQLAVIRESGASTSDGAA